MMTSGLAWRGVRRGLAAALLAAGLLACLSSPALAHGERSQEAFLRTQTVAFLDVRFSATAVGVGEPVTVTGRFRVLEGWPSHTIPPPDRAFLTVAVPGPVFVVEERVVGGEFVIQQMALERGRTYDFRLRLVARRTGRWHVHPAVSFEGAGPLLGPGRTVEVRPGATDFRNPLRLRRGRTVDLETYALGRVALWHLVTFAVALSWIMYWLGRPLLGRRRLVSAGAEADLITRRDLKVGAGFAALAAAVLVAGVVYARLAWPNTIPPQVRLDRPPAAPETPPLVEADVTRATFDEAAHALTLQVDVRNRADEAVRLASFTTAYLTFREPKAGGTHTAEMRANRSTVIGPGAAASLTLDLHGEAWRTEHLVALDEAQARLGGLLRFVSASGSEDLVDVDVEVIPAL